MATIVGRLRLDELKVKPMPNKKQKVGVEVFLEGLSGKLEKPDRDKPDRDKPDTSGKTNTGMKTMEEEDVENEGEKREQEYDDADAGKKSTKVGVTIVDGRKTSQIDREAILQSLASRNIFTVGRVPLTRQTPIVEDIVEDFDGEEKKELAKDTTGKTVAIKIRRKSTEADVDVSKPAKKPKLVVHGPSQETAALDQTVVNTTVINGLTLERRLPKKPKQDIIMNASPYYLNNRKQFIQKLVPLFSKYQREMSDGEKVVSCDAMQKGRASAEFKLLTHQKVVRDYLNLYSPYRGLLLYHGLGSGKTCTSIAIAEGMKSEKHVVVMTLASLKYNFFEQMKVCGDPIYKVNQFWEFISTDGNPDYVPLLSKALSLSTEFIRRRRGAWLTNVAKAPNFADLDDADQVAVNEQIDEMIRAKYTDINYNGLNKGVLDRLTDNQTRNPFDNAVVIIDEAHNFVSRIVNKLRDKTSISYKLYEYLMNASNARIVLLTGTPIINYPNEIGILFNILRGYINTWTFPVQLEEGGEKPSRENILTWFEDAGMRSHDYVEFSGDQLVVTRNPFGFVDKLEGRGKPRVPKYVSSSKGAVVQEEKKKEEVEVEVEVEATKDAKEKLPRCPNGEIRNKKTKKCEPKPDKTKVGGGKNRTKKDHRSKKSTKAEKPLPPVEVKRGLAIIPKPLDGPTEDQTDEDRQEMVRANLETQMGGAREFDDYEGVELDETGNMSDQDFVNTIIRILGRHGVTVSRPKVKLTQHKALPDNSKTFLEMFVELGSKEMKNENVFQKRILGLTSYFKSADESLLPDFVPSDHDPVYHIERCEMSGYQFGLYEKIRSEESNREKKSKKAQSQRVKQGVAAAEELFKVSSTYRIASRMCCNFAFPDPPGRPVKGAGEKGGDEDVADEGELDEDEDKDKVEEADEGKDKDEVGEAGEGKVEAGEEADEGKEEEKEETKPGKPPAKTEKRPRCPSGTNWSNKTQKCEPKKVKEKRGGLGSEDEGSETDEDAEHADADTKVVAEDADANTLEGSEAEEDDTVPLDENYAKRIQRALSDIKARSDEIFSPAGLQIYSPKFLKILENIQNPDHQGLHLIYSVFRSLEGIAILKLVLEANGYAEFKIEQEGGRWELVDRAEDMGKSRFVLYTGTETDEEKRILLNVYNSKWAEVPSGIVATIHSWKTVSGTKGKGERGGEDVENNFMGDVIKVLMITASGAEGINLKNTRYVHIVEPYWHMVRLQQVIGRARRICSHQDLPKELRTVQVFLYMAVLTEQQAKDPKHIELRTRDVSRLSKKKGQGTEDADSGSLLGRYVQGLDIVPGVVTTDQILFENALSKDHVNGQILDAVKETAMDCQLYAKDNRSENLVCYGFGKVRTNAFASYPTLEQDLAEKDVKEVREVKVRLVKIMVPDQKGQTRPYALNPNTKEVFDFEDYKLSRDTGAQLVRLGFLEKGRDGTEKIVLDK